MADVKKNVKRQNAKPAGRSASGRRLPGFFSDYGGSGIVVDSMPGQKKKQKK